MKPSDAPGRLARTRDALFWPALTLGAVMVAAGGAFSIYPAGVAFAQPAATRQFPGQNFDRVKVNGSSTVNIRKGSTFSVTARGPAPLLDRLTTEVVNGELQIGMKPGAWSGPDHVTVEVTLPALRAVALNGSGDIVADHIIGDPASRSAAGVALDGSGNVRVVAIDATNIAITLSGSGDVSTKNIKADSVSIALAGSGDLIASGSTTQTQITVNGSGDMDAAALNAQTATIALNGSGDVSARANRSATINASGTGGVILRGTAACTIQKSATAEVSCAP